MQSLLLLIIALYCVNGFQNDVLYQTGIHLSNVTSVTGYKGQFTNARRVPPIQQISCVGGAAMNHQHQVSAIQCTNSGFNGHDYEWKCTPQAPSHLKLGRARVSCEGFNSAEDSYKLVNSCGIKYTLEYNQLPTKIINTDYHINTESRARNNAAVGIANFMGFCFVALIFLMCFISCSSPSRTSYVPTSTYVPTYVTPVVRPTYVATSPNIVVVPQSSSVYVDDYSLTSTSYTSSYTPSYTSTSYTSSKSSSDSQSAFADTETR